MKQNRNSSPSRLRFAMAAATIAVLVVMPIAWANGANGPIATKSASLAKQVKSLKQRIAALEKRQSVVTTNTTTTGNGTPSGPAGGDLTGTYPNPTIGDNKVTGAKVADGTLNGADVADDGLSGLDIVDSTILGRDVAANSLFADVLGTGSAGNDELKGVHSVIGQSVTVSNNSTNTATVACPAGEQLIGGGGAYATNATGESIIASAPGGNPGEFFTEWVVSGANTSGSAKELIPWASCLIH